MKFNIIKILTYLIAPFICFYLLNSCKEVGPDIDLGGNNSNDTSLIDTSYIITNIPPAQQKVVLLEDFTGVRCINCPDGHLQAENILNTYPEKVIAVSMHSNFLGVAYDNQPELRIAEAQDLEELLGPAAAKPMAAIDRVLYSGETSVLQFLQQWSGRVAQEINSTVPVNIDLQNRIEQTDSGKNIITKVTLTYLQNTNVENRLTVFLEEENVRAAQLTSSGVDSNYIHKHTARAFFTRFNGVPLATTPQQGTVIVKEFKLNNINANFKIEDLNVIAFVHEFGSSQRVLQVQVKKVE